MSVWPDHYFYQNPSIATPFIKENVSPASIDLTLAPEYIDLRDGQRHTMGDGIDLWPGVAILACTVERIKLPPNCAGQVMLKSSAARRGLDHALAGWVDPGFEGDLTLELHAHRPVTLRPGERLVQMVVFDLSAFPLRPYGETGRYQGQRGPTEAR
jgi:dCTP deaminase